MYQDNILIEVGVMEPSGLALLSVCLRCFTSKVLFENDSDSAIGDAVQGARTNYL